MSFESDMEDIYGIAPLAKRGEAADRLRNILNKYKQGSNCKYDWYIINDSCIAWLIFRFDSYDTTYLTCAR